MSRKDGDPAGKSSDTNIVDYGLSDIKRGLKKGVEKGREDLSEAWSKFKHNLQIVYLILIGARCAR